MSATTSLPEPVDLGIVVALPDEFREMVKLIDAYTPCGDDDLTAYRFERAGYSIVATLVGDMGESQATRVTERLIARFPPVGIVVVGIAAGVHDDLRVGDIYVPPQAVQYMQDAKASPKKATRPAAKTAREAVKSAAAEPGGFHLDSGAPAYRADHAFIESVRNLEFKHPDLHRAFRAACSADLVALLSEKERGRLIKQDLVRSEPVVLVDGHVATGPVVGAAAAFSAWIRSHDRNVKALEMESAAVLLAAHSRGTATRAFVIRGISDYGDDRKKALDMIGKGALRQYAMRNAVRLLWAMIDVGALPRNPR